MKRKTVPDDIGSAADDPKRFVPHDTETNDAHLNFLRIRDWKLWQDLEDRRRQAEILNCFQKRAQQ